MTILTANPAKSKLFLLHDHKLKKKKKIIKVFYLYLCFYRGHDRTPEELEIIYEELVHTKALAHLSNTVKRELAAVIMFEAHPKAGTVCEFPLLSVCQ